MGDRRPKHDSLPPEAPPTAEELADAARLRDALDDPSAPLGDDLDLVRSLKAAWSPGALDADDHAGILEDAPASDEELRIAAALRETLERDDLVVTLRAAHAPRALDDVEHERILQRALEPNVVPLRPRIARVRFAAVTVTTALALAAGLLVWITNGATNEAPLARARSTQPLFGEPFKAGETSARIDRIAVARASDYRDNRFAKWGVR